MANAIPYDYAAEVRKAELMNEMTKGSANCCGAAELSYYPYEKAQWDKLKELVATSKRTIYFFAMDQKGLDQVNPLKEVGFIEVARFAGQYGAYEMVLMMHGCAGRGKGTLRASAGGQVVEKVVEKIVEKVVEKQVVVKEVGVKMAVKVATEKKAPVKRERAEIDY